LARGAAANAWRVKPTEKRFIMFHNLPTIDTEGLLVTYHQNGITEMVIRDLRRTTVDLFIAAMGDHDRVCLQNNRHALRIIRTFVPYPTPYFTTKIITATKQTAANHRESDAVITPDTRMMLVVRGFVARLEKSTNVSIRLCVSEKEAFDWFAQRRQLLGD
jgi:hypothetical protein